MTNAFGLSNEHPYFVIHHYDSLKMTQSKLLDIFIDRIFLTLGGNAYQQTSISFGTKVL